jgi:hypothetical protein
VSTHRLAAFAALAASGALATGALAATSSAHSAPKLWQNPTHKVGCGVMIGGKDVLCSAKPIPAPPHTNSSDGDPGFVSIGKTGKPTLLRTSQDEFEGTTPKTEKQGTTWTYNGVSCTIAAKSVTCKNKSGHGFEIYGGGKNYKSF